MGVPHLVVVSGPVLVFVKNDSRAFRGGMKSWGWTGEGKFVPFNSRTGTSYSRESSESSGWTLGAWTGDCWDSFQDVDALNLMV